MYSTTTTMSRIYADKIVSCLSIKLQYYVNNIQAVLYRLKIIQALMVANCVWVEKM